MGYRGGISQDGAGQLRTLSLLQVDVGAELLPLHLFGEVTEGDGVAVQVGGGGDLEHVAGEDDLRA